MPVNDENKNLTSQEVLQLIQGMQSAQDKADAEFDPMKGRTFIPRMSPAMKRMMVEAIREARVKREKRRKAKRNEQSQLQNQDLKILILC